jgi:hypothetical protein
VEGDPYQIWTAEDMQAIGADANYWGAYFLLCADINLAAYTGTSFNIIGWNDGRIGNPFTGVFDGNGQSINHFSYYDPNRPSAGIFGYTSSAFEVRDLTLSDVNVVGNYYVGSLVGLNYGKIERCSVTGVVAGTENVGGLVGMNEEGGKIADCNSNVIMRNHGYLFAVGCLVGYNFEGDVIDCFSAGIIDGNDETYMAGGLAGFNRGRISRCYSTADVSGYWYVGGLIGEHDWYDLQSCYATGDILCEA